MNDLIKLKQVKSIVFNNYNKYLEDENNNPYNMIVFSIRKSYADVNKSFCLGLKLEGKGSKVEEKGLGSGINFEHLLKELELKGKEPIKQIEGWVECEVHYDAYYVNAGKSAVGIVSTNTSEISENDILEYLNSDKCTEKEFIDFWSTADNFINI